MRTLNLALLAFSIFGSIPAIAEAPLAIGGLFDLTTPAGAVWGNDERDGFLLAIEDFKLGNPGTEVRYAIEDSAYSNTKSVTALQKLTALDKVNFVVGPTWETFSATAPVCEKQKTVCFAPSHNGSTFENPARELRYSFTGFYPERGYSTKLTAEMSADKRSRIIGVAAITDYFETLNDAFVESAPQKPLAVDRFAPETTDFRSAITKAPRDIDAIFLALDGNGQNWLFLSQWTQLRRDRPSIYAHDGILYEPRWTEIQKLGFTIKVSKPHVAPGFEAAWKEKFNARFGREPGAPSGAIAYDETSILLACMKQHRSEVVHVRDCIANTANHKGMSGMIDFSGKQAVTSRTFAVETFLPAEK